MQKYKLSLNEHFERELFLIEQGNFDIQGINNMSVIDFDLFYSKEIQKKLEQQEAMEAARHNNKNKGFTF